MVATADLNPLALAIADVNSDGHLDIISVNYEAYHFSVITGTGDGRFARALPYGCGQGPAYVFVSDLNGDGRPDIVTTNQFSDDLTISLHVPY